MSHDGVSLRYSRTRPLMFCQPRDAGDPSGNFPASAHAISASRIWVKSELIAPWMALTLSGVTKVGRMSPTWSTGPSLSRRAILIVPFRKDVTHWGNHGPIPRSLYCHRPPRSEHARASRDPGERTARSEAASPEARRGFVVEALAENHDGCGDRW